VRFRLRLSESFEKSGRAADGGGGEGAEGCRREELVGAGRVFPNAGLRNFVTSLGAILELSSSVTSSSMIRHGLENLSGQFLLRPLMANESPLF